MLMTSGVKFGFARTAPHLIGVILGFGLMIVLVGLGLNVVFERFPSVLPVMRVVGSVYMLWLALKIALAKPVHARECASRPIGFFGAAAFQWVNPKAWVMVLSMLSTYSASAQRAADRRALRADYNPLQRRLGPVRLLDAPVSGQPENSPAVQLRNGDSACRINRPDLLRIT